MTTKQDTSGEAALTAILKDARPRVVSALLRYFRDLDRAQDAFQEACLRALRHWPAKGQPRDPVSWLIFVGRNAGVDSHRKSARFTAMSPELEAGDATDPEEEIIQEMDQQVFQDDFIRLFFVCCHPDLPVEQQIPLALRIIAGMSVAEIARAFLIQPKSMEQRITRAKRKIRDLDIPYSIPLPSERQERLQRVRMALYLLFNEGYSASSGDQHIRPELCHEALRLTRHLLALFPSDPECQGLLALMLLQQSREAARLDNEGEIILLEDQDRNLWNSSQILEGTLLLEKALMKGQPGPLQIQAAIAATHARADQADNTDWHEIERLYQALSKISPSPVITLNHAVAISKCHGAAPALDMIQPLEQPLYGYFHYHALAGAWLRDLGQEDQALIAFERAISLARTVAEAAHIRDLIEKISK